MHDPVLVFQSLGDPVRWRIIQLMLKEALCVCEVAEILDMPQSSVSSHLQVLRKAGLLESERCEKWIYYRATRNARAMLEMTEQYFESNPALDATLARDAKRALKRLSRRAETCCPGPKELASSLPAKSTTHINSK